MMLVHSFFLIAFEERKVVYQGLNSLFWKVQTIAL